MLRHVVSCKKWKIHNRRRSEMWCWPAMSVASICLWCMILVCKGSPPSIVVLWWAPQVLWIPPATLMSMTLPWLICSSHDPHSHDCAMVDVHFFNIWARRSWRSMRAPSLKSSESVSLNDLPSLHPESNSCWSHNLCSNCVREPCCASQASATSLCKDWNYRTHNTDMLNLDENKLRSEVCTKWKKWRELKNNESTNSQCKDWEKIMKQYRCSLLIGKKCKIKWIQWMIQENFKQWNQITVGDCLTFPVNLQWFLSRDEIGE